MAEKYLSAADWEEIDAAFLGHSDPMLGVRARAEFDSLFTRIVNLAPAHRPQARGAMTRHTALNGTNQRWR